MSDDRPPVLPRRTTGALSIEAAKKGVRHVIIFVSYVIVDLDLLTV